MTDESPHGGRVREWVKRYLATLLGMEAKDIVLDCDLGRYGLDSVDAVMMAGELEKELGFEIDPAAFLQHPTLESMVAALELTPRPAEDRAPA